MVRGAHIGERIGARLEQLGMTQRKLADELKVRDATVSDWIGGKQQPRADAILLLRQALGMTLDELLGVAEGQNPPFDTWTAFRRSPLGEAISDDEERFLKSPLWPHGRQPTVEAYHSMLMLVRHGTEPRRNPA